MYQFKLPDIGEGVVEAEVIEWKVREGEALLEDQVFVELMTDKASIEIPSPVSGRVQRLCYEVGDVVPVGATLIEIDEGGEAPVRSAESAEEHPPVAREPVAAAQPPGEPVENRDADPARPTGDPAAPVGATRERTSAPLEPHPPVMPARPSRPAGQPGSGVERRAVPAVRELAKRLGVDLLQVDGSGPGGRVMRRDVEQVAAEATRQNALLSTSASADSPPPRSTADALARESEAPASDPADWQRLPLRGIRRAIARHMLEARRRTAHFSYVEEVDVSELLSRSEEHKRESSDDELSPLAFIARAVVRVLPDFPMLNASIDDAREELVLKQHIHLGVAVAAADSLLVPVIENATHLSTLGLAHEITQLAERARRGELTPGELRGSTFTLTSLGRLGGIVSTPILNYPESAILGINAIRLLPRYLAGELVPRSVMNLSLSVDHRIADGYMAANFVQGLRKILEEGDFPDLFSPPSSAS